MLNSLSITFLVSSFFISVGKTRMESPKHPNVLGFSK